MSKEPLFASNFKGVDPHGKSLKARWSIYSIDKIIITLYTVFTVLFEAFSSFFRGSFGAAVYDVLFWRSTPFSGVLRLFIALC